MTRDDIVATARAWVGTPFHHQGRMRGVGVDCAGVAIGVAKDLGLPYEDVRGYGHQPSGGIFRRKAEELLERITREEVLPGDLAEFAFDSEPQHIAIVTGINPITMVHAWAQARRCVENSLDETWEKRLRGFYRFKGLA